MAYGYFTSVTTQLDGLLQVIHHKSNYQPHNSSRHKACTVRPEERHYMHQARSLDVQNALEANANNTEPGNTPVGASNLLTSISVICEFEYRSGHERHCKNLNSRIRLITEVV